MINIKSVQGHASLIRSRSKGELVEGQLSKFLELYNFYTFCYSLIDIVWIFIFATPQYVI